MPTQAPTDHHTCDDPGEITDSSRPRGQQVRVRASEDEEGAEGGEHVATVVLDHGTRIEGTAWQVFFGEARAPSSHSTRSPCTHSPCTRTRARTAAPVPQHGRQNDIASAEQLGLSKTPTAKQETHGPPK